MFEGDKWAKQTAIVVLVHAAPLIILEVFGIPRFAAHGVALLSATLIITGMHRSNGNMMFKNEKWEQEAMLTLGMLGLTSAFLTSYYFPVTLGVMHALVWYIRKKTGGEKRPVTVTEDEKIGSPF